VPREAQSLNPKPPRRQTVARGAQSGASLLNTVWTYSTFSPSQPSRLQQEMVMQMLKQTVWSSLNNADAWVVCIGVMSCLGLATGLLG
jgi:hypothetical protein